MIKALIPLANGTEEMEAVIIVDLLRRAQWEVVVAGVDPGLLTASRGVRLMPDTVWTEVCPDDFDLLVIPGGAAGVERFLKFRPLLDCIIQFNQAHKWIGAVCAAPLTLQAAGILTGRKATCHPGVASRLTATPWLNESTVIDGHLVTSQGAGTSIEFALTLILLADSQAKASAIAGAIVFGDKTAVKGS